MKIIVVIISILVILFGVIFLISSNVESGAVVVTKEVPSEVQEYFNKKLGELRDVFLSITQWREVDRDYIESIKEILTKIS